jgi:hypothetical protein
MKRIETAFIVIVSICCMAPSAWINAAHQFARSPGSFAYPLAFAAMLSVFFAGLSAVAFEKTIAQKHYGQSIVAAAAFCVFAAYNLSSAVGASSTTRSDLVAPRQQSAARANLLSGQIAAAERSRAALVIMSKEQTPGMVDNDLAVWRNDDKWSRSKKCEDATLPDSRSFCADYAKKLAQREAAAKVGELDGMITSLKSELLKSGGASDQPADPQADNIAQAFAFIGAPTTVGGVGTGLNLWFALTIEMLGSVGPSIARWSMRSFGKNEQSDPVKHPADPSVAPPQEEVAQGGPGQTEQVAQASGPGVAQAKPRARKRGPKSGGPGPEKAGGPGVAHGGPGWPTSSVNNVITVGPPMLERVAQMVAQGQSEREIAKALGVGRTTVQRLKRAAAGRGSASVVVRGGSEA